MKIENKSIYFAYTSYHVFIALLMALSKHNEKDEQQLVIIGNFSDAEKMYKSLVSCDNSPFNKVFYLRGEYNLQQYGSSYARFFRYWGVLKICQDVISLINDEKITQIYLFNEERAYSLILLNYISKLKGRIKASFIEDGTTIYSSYVERKDWHYLFLGKIFFGLWWKNVPVMGSSVVFDDIWAFFPQFVREELKNKSIKSIPTNLIADLRTKKIASHILSNYGINSEYIDKINCMVLLSHSSVINQFSEYRGMLSSLIKKMQTLGYQITIKYHPRDNASDDFLGLSSESNINVLHSSVPLELIYVLGVDSIKVVISDMTTSALMAQLILKNTKVISIGALLGSKDERFLNMLRCLGISLPESFEDFDQCLVMGNA